MPPPPPSRPPPQVARSPLRPNKDFLQSLVGVLRLAQLACGAALWITIASKKYEGAIHFALFVAVFFWLFTLAIFLLTLLDRQDLVPLLGGDRWLSTNAVYDALSTCLHAAAAGIMIQKTMKNEYCNVEAYKHYCFYKIYLVASFFACLCCLLYLMSAIIIFVKKCRGNQSIV